MTPRAAIPIPRLFPVVAPIVTLFLLLDVIVKSFPSLKTNPFALVPKEILKSLTLVVVWLSLKYAPTNLSFVPVIFPTIKSWLVLDLIATIPFASSPIKLISPLFFKLVFVSPFSLVVYIAVPLVPILIFAPVWLSIFAPTV